MNQTVEEAKTYLRFSLVMQQKYFDVLLSTTNIERNWNILEVGCGTGNSTLKLAHKVGLGGNVIAIDPIHQRIIEAEENNNAKNINYSVAYGKDAVSFGEGRFDLVVAGTVMHRRRESEDI